jgi:hypothetical protein
VHKPCVRYCCTIVFFIVFFSWGAVAQEYVPLMSAATGREIARAYRTDGTAPTEARAAGDKKACLLDPKEISNAVADRLSALVRTDREAAEVEVAKAVIPCMARKGWRTVIIGAAAPGIDDSTTAMIDDVLDRFSSSLPQKMDEISDLVKVRREKSDIIYTIRIKPSSQESANLIRDMQKRNPRAADNIRVKLAKRQLCEPVPNRYLTEGFTVVHEFYDNQGLLQKSRIVLADCK